MPLKWIVYFKNNQEVSPRITARNLSVKDKVAVAGNELALIAERKYCPLTAAAMRTLLPCQGYVSLWFEPVEIVD